VSATNGHGRLHGVTVLPTARSPRARQWRAAIASASAAGLRHTPDCHRKGALKTRAAKPARLGHLSIPGCPWCDHIRTHLEDESVR
jgi:hypothetical protein